MPASCSEIGIEYDESLRDLYNMLLRRQDQGSSFPSMEDNEGDDQEYESSDYEIWKQTYLLDVG